MDTTGRVETSGLLLKGPKRVTLWNAVRRCRAAGYVLLLLTILSLGLSSCTMAQKAVMPDIKQTEAECPPSAQEIFSEFITRWSSGNPEDFAQLEAYLESLGKDYGQCTDDQRYPARIAYIFGQDMYKREFDQGAAEIIALLEEGASEQWRWNSDYLGNLSLMLDGLWGNKLRKEKFGASAMPFLPPMECRDFLYPQLPDEMYAIQWFPCGAQTATVPITVGGSSKMSFSLIPHFGFDVGGQYIGESLESAENHLPKHYVQIRYNYYMGQYEVTQAQWNAVMGTYPSGCDAEHDDYPVHHVSWNEINGPGGFLDRLNSIGAGTFRLPSEAEWEFACAVAREAADRIPIERIPEAAWCSENSSGIRPVGGKDRNGYCLYDMLGNIQEWCYDWYHESYDLERDEFGEIDAPYYGEAWLCPAGEERVIRGGYWGTPAMACHPSMRWKADPATQSESIGLRLVWIPPVVWEINHSGEVLISLQSDGRLSLGENVDYRITDQEEIDQVVNNPQNEMIWVLWDTAGELQTAKWVLYSDGTSYHLLSTGLLFGTYLLMDSPDPGSVLSFQGDNNETIAKIIEVEEGEWRFMVKQRWDYVCPRTFEGACE